LRLGGNGYSRTRSARFQDSARCLVQSGPGDALLPDTIRIALTEPVHLAVAPMPANDAEQLVFRQMFENLVQVDCEGHLAPGAALSWSTVDSGSSWTVMPGNSIRTWVGQQVRAGWRSLTIEEPDSGCLRP
jgi:hypothetical protein